ncbi:MAG: type II toxin-antitoxin system MqsR family toxin [Janthinobacterium lividum]
MSEKKKPTYDLDSFKAAFSSESALAMTFIAANDAANLGFGKSEIVSILQTMQTPHFYKSMTSHSDYKIWQDVYHVPSRVGVLYIKFTAGTVTLFKLLLFKEKDNG